jgi:putative MFS transporter
VAAPEFDRRRAPHRGAGGAAAGRRPEEGADDAGPSSEPRGLGAGRDRAPRHHLMVLETAAQPPAALDYDAAPFGAFHRRVAVASVGGVFADGFGLGIIGIALSLAAPQLGLGPLWLGLLGGASLAGLFVGALATGPAADRVGRRPVYASNMIVAALVSASQCLVTTGLQLLLLRILIGFVLGTDYVVSKALLAEFMPVRSRARVLSLLSVAWAGGYASAYTLGAVLAALGPDAWRWMLLASALPCLAIAPLRLTMPESPVWLARRGDTARAARIVLARLGATVLPPRAVAAAEVRPTPWRELFSAACRTRTLVACAFFTCQVVPYFAVGTFVTQMLAALHVRGGYAGGIAYNAALLLGAIGGVLMIDRVSRRRFLVGSFSMAAAAMLVLSASPNLPAVAMIALLSLFAGVVSAASNLVYVYVPELFPTTLRASGIGLAVAASRVGSAVGTFVLPVVMSAWGAQVALGACFVILVFGAVICWRLAPETGHLGLEALDRLYGGAAAAPARALSPTEELRWPSEHNSATRS